MFSLYQWLVWQWWFALNEKEQEHKLEHGMQSNVDIIAIGGLVPWQT